MSQPLLHHSIGALDSTRLSQLCFQSLRLRHCTLFAGERLALLVDCDLVAIDADLDEVASAAIGLFTRLIVAV